MLRFLIPFLGGVLGHMVWDYIKENAFRYRWSCDVCVLPERFTCRANNLEGLDLIKDRHLEHHLEKGLR